LTQNFLPIALRESGQALSEVILSDFHSIRGSAFLLSHHDGLNEDPRAGDDLVLMVGMNEMSAVSKLSSSWSLILPERGISPTARERRNLIRHRVSIDWTTNEL
jgi:hypothetical protein